jgi:hypothetical protein
MPKYTAAEDEGPCCNCNGRCEVHMLQLQRAKIYCMVWMAELIRAIHMQGALYRHEKCTTEIYCKKYIMQTIET